MQFDFYFICELKFQELFFISMSQNSVVKFDFHFYKLLNN